MCVGAGRRWGGGGVRRARAAVQVTKLVLSRLSMFAAAVSR